MTEQRPRLHPIGWRAPAAPVVHKTVAVKRIGRDRERHYCPRCGQKRRVCRCPPKRGELP